MSEVATLAGKRALVTGANGYIGQHLVEALLCQDCQVIALMRSAARLRDHGKLTHVVYDMSAPFPADIFLDVDIAFHLASSLSTAGRPGAAEELDVTAARQFLGACPQSCFAVFVSSQSALGTAQTAYSRAKRRIEGLFRERQAAIVRPGMVYGGRQAGLYGKICRMGKSRPLWVLPRLPPAVQPVAIENLVQCLIRIAAHRLAGTWNLAQSRPITFREFVLQITYRRFGLSPIVLHLPAMLFRIGARLPGINGERIGGLLGLRPMLVVEAEANGLQCRALVAPETGFNRRAFVTEAVTFCRYLAPERRIRLSWIRLYLRLMIHDHARPIGIPSLLFRYPRLVRGCEPLASMNSVAKERIKLCAKILEAAPGAANSLYLQHDLTPWQIILGLCRTTITEIALFPFRRMTQRLWRLHEQRR